MISLVKAPFRGYLFGKVISRYTSGTNQLVSYLVRNNGNNRVFEIHYATQILLEFKRTCSKAQAVIILNNIDSLLETLGSLPDTIKQGIQEGLNNGIL